jgi:hypothetical protein
VEAGTLFISLMKYHPYSKKKISLPLPSRSFAVPSRLRPSPGCGGGFWQKRRPLLCFLPFTSLDGRSKRTDVRQHPKSGGAKSGGGDPSCDETMRAGFNKMFRFCSRRAGAFPGSSVQREQWEEKALASL